MHARLREWEHSHFKKLYLLKYRVLKQGLRIARFAFEQIEFVAFVIWLFAKALSALFFAFFVGSRMVRHHSIEQLPEEIHEGERIQGVGLGGGLWK